MANRPFSTLDVIQQWMTTGPAEAKNANSKPAAAQWSGQDAWLIWSLELGWDLYWLG